jgi:DNA modification methylase
MGQAAKKGLPPPTNKDIADEVFGKETEYGSYTENVRKSVIVSKHLADPDVAKAKSVDDAFKVLKRKEETQRHTDYAAEIGKTFSAKVHTVLQGDCIEIMPTMPMEAFDVIITDPPYGIGADEYGDSGGRVAGGHEYDDSLETWAYLMRGFSVQSFRLAKPLAHLYVFCDIDNFVSLKKMMIEAGWRMFRTPIVCVNPTAMRTPWPEHGPQRKYQLIAYGVKGDRRVNHIAPDVVSYPSDENLGHAAQKPVALIEDLLKRSIHPGDTVFDPFCGSGPIFPAAHSLKCRATGIELKPSAYSVAVQRVEKL